MFIPLGDDNSQRRIIPLVVWIFFGINLLIWYLQLSFGESFTYGYSTVPFEITHGVDLTGVQHIRMLGHDIDIDHAAGPSPIYFTLLSSMFMHGSWGHIIGNMVYLLIFADQIEDLLGHGRFIIFYIMCGICASLAHVLVDPNSVIPSLGASGAIAGVLGAYLVHFPGNSVRVLVMRNVILLPASVVLGAWILLQLISQVSVISGAPTGVAYMAHIGGFLVGVPLSFLMQKR